MRSSNSVTSTGRAVSALTFFRTRFRLARSKNFQTGRSLVLSLTAHPRSLRQLDVSHSTVAPTVMEVPSEEVDDHPRTFIVGLDPASAGRRSGGSVSRL